MKFYIMTDLEGVAGVGSKAEWTGAASPYYDQARQLLTDEVNAAAIALLDMGASQVHVADGHGPGGIRPDLLNPQVVLHNKWARPPYPFSLDDSFSAILYIGQHAKAGSLNAHLPHTGSHHVLDSRVNGLSIGEFGEFAIIADYLGVPIIFGSGDLAFTKEARALVPHMITVAVKEGKNKTSGEEYSFEVYDDLFHDSVSLRPETARIRIIMGVAKAVSLLKDKGPAHFTGRGIPQPPYFQIKELRSFSGQPARAILKTHASDPVALFNSEGEEVYRIWHKGHKTKI